MKTICSFNILNENGSVDGWITPIDFHILPDFKNIEYFLEEVSKTSGHDVVECIAVFDENMHMVYSSTALTQNDYDIINEMSIGLKERG